MLRCPQDVSSSVVTLKVSVKRLILGDTGTDTIWNCYYVTDLWYVVEMEVNCHIFLTH
jgi:hypothetical protein